MTVIYDHDELGRPIVHALSDREHDGRFRDATVSRCSSFVMPMVHDYGIGSEVPRELGRLWRTSVRVRVGKEDAVFVAIAKRVYRFVKTLDIRPRYVVISECGRLLRRLRGMIEENRKKKVMTRKCGCDYPSLIATVLILITCSEYGIPVDEGMLSDVSGCNVLCCKTMVRRCLGVYVRSNVAWRFNELRRRVTEMFSAIGISNAEVIRKALQYSEYLLRRGRSVKTAACVGVYEALHHFGILVKVKEFERLSGCKDSVIRNALASHARYVAPPEVYEVIGKKYFMEVPKYLEGYI